MCCRRNLLLQQRPGAGQPELREKVVEAVRSQQSGPEAEQFSLLAAAVLEKAILGTITPRDTLAALDLEATTAAQGGDPTAQRLMMSVTKAMDRLRQLRHQGLDERIQVCRSTGSVLCTNSRAFIRWTQAASRRCWWLHACGCV